MSHAGALVPEEEDFAALLESMGACVAPGRGDIRYGVVVYARPGEVIVDIGAKQEAIVAPRELEAIPREELQKLQEGDSILVYVVRPAAFDEPPVVSIERAKAHEDWLRAEEFLQTGEIVSLTVTGYNRGGLLCDWGRIQGFVPASQVSRVSRRRTAGDEEPLARLVGEELPLKVIEVDRRRRRLVLSERQAMREWRERQRARLLDELAEGQTRTGTVSNIVDFGAFVDLGGMDGLIHVSELAWQRVTHPSECLQIGQTVEVLVLRVERDRERIGLSLKRLAPDPWADVATRFTAGQVLDGLVTHLARFGAFVELEPGVEGLIHVSELGRDQVSGTDEVVRAGQAVRVAVLSIDPHRRQIALRLYQDTDELQARAAGVGT